MSKILIGTMYSGEGDFDRCCESVRHQNYGCQQFFVSNLSEVDAHAKLYKAFKESDADYLLKLDADMVLNDCNVIDYLLDIIQKGNYLRVTHYVDDFFTNKPMLGIHFFSKEVEWKFDQFKSGHLFPDCLDTIREMKMKKRCLKIRKSIAKHCYYANPRQSFHFGYHRFLKGKISVCNATIQHLKQFPDSSSLRYAGLGIIAASKYKDYGSYNYGDSFNSLFNKYLEKEIKSTKIIKKAKRCLKQGI